MQEAYATIQAASRLIDAMGVQQVTGRSEELAHMGRLRGRRMRRGELRRSMGGRRFKRHGDDRGRELTKAISAPSQTKKTYPECPRPSSTTSQTIRTTATTRRAPERRTRGEKRCFARDNAEPNSDETGGSEGDKDARNWSRELKNASRLTGRTRAQKDEEDSPRWTRDEPNEQGGIEAVVPGHLHSASTSRLRRADIEGQEARWTEPEGLKVIRSPREIRVRMNFE